MPVGVWIRDYSWHESWIIYFVDVAWNHLPQLTQRNKKCGGSGLVESCRRKWSCWLQFGHIKCLRPLLNVQKRINFFWEQRMIWWSLKAIRAYRHCLIIKNVEIELWLLLFCSIKNLRQMLNGFPNLAKV